MLYISVKYKHLIVFLGLHKYNINIKMKVTVTNWPISQLQKIRGSILEQPKYQRGKVWKSIKNQLLIDSILRGIDLPKIYLRKIKHGIHDYEIADGQQRINAINLFMDDNLILSSQTYKGLDLSKIGHYQVGGKKKSEINAELREKFENNKLTIAIVEEASNSEIRTLFGRLQMGDPLNPAEIRNAIISNIGDHIDLLVQSHDFFTNSKINGARYKKQDYLVHCFALLHYGNKYDLKAPLFQRLYYDLSSGMPQEYIDTSFRTLSFMHAIDKAGRKRIINKWSFVDIFHLISTYGNKIRSIDNNLFSRIFQDFERLRTITKKPEQLIEGKTPTREEKDLYDYIMAFNSNGGNPKNIETRYKVFEHLFSSAIILK